MPQYKN